jgi:hypothetical protein
MRKYMHGVQLSIGLQRKPIQQAMQTFDLLEEFQYRYTLLPHMLYESR